MAGKEVLIVPGPHVQRSFRTAYGPRFRVSMSFDGPGRTKQSFKDEADINVLMGRYLESGIFPVAEAAPIYADVTGYDFLSSQLRVAQVKGIFSQMPSSVRERFQNDPAQMLDFVADPANHAEAVKLGIAQDRVQAIPVGSPTPPATPTSSVVQTPSSTNVEGVSTSSSPTTPAK